MQLLDAILAFAVAFRSCSFVRILKVGALVGALLGALEVGAALVGLRVVGEVVVGVAEVGRAVVGDTVVGLSDVGDGVLTVVGFGPVGEGFLLELDDVGFVFEPEELEELEVGFLVGLMEVGALVVGAGVDVGTIVTSGPTLSLQPQEVSEKVLEQYTVIPEALQNGCGRLP